MSQYGHLGFRILPGAPAPDAALVARLSTYATPNLADAMENFYAMSSHIHRMFPAPKVVGSALTVRLRSADNLMLHKAISLAQPGDVLVVETQGCDRYAVMGELMATAAVRMGVVGIVVDGCVRDVEEIAELGIGVYALGTAPCVGDKEGPGEINCPICCGGVPVQPGDIIVADADGVVVIDREHASSVMDRADTKLSYEGKRREEIASGAIAKPDIDRKLRAKGILPET